MNYKKLSKINDAVISGTFKVGNLNDYFNVINKLNLLENSSLSVEDFEQFESDYSDEKFSYKVLNYEDDNSVKSIKLNNAQYLNFYKLN